MSSYETLASCYDSLTLDVNYPEWANYIKKHLEKEEIPGDIVLDLACGTGSLTFALAELGYEMIGADLSADMLAQAMEKNYEFQGKKPIFLCQAMENLDLYGTIDACVCCLDSVNYVTEPETLQKAFSKVSLFLMPGGVFLFDIKSPFAFEKQDGQISLDETEDIYCVWRTELSENKEISHHYMDLFLKNGKTWQRHEEIHAQRVYTLDSLKQCLKNSGFSDIRLFGNLSWSAPTSQEERIFFLAKKI